MMTLSAGLKAIEVLVQDLDDGTFLAWKSQQTCCEAVTVSQVSLKLETGMQIFALGFFHYYFSNIHTVL